MASSTPDPALHTSSAQIFSSNHTLPQIRSIHKALLLQVDDKAARLRTQVGGSYRELLGTADAIVGMRRDMDAVQAGLARAGARCGRAVVGGKVAALARFVDGDGEDDSVGGPEGRRKARAALVARARLLEACVLVVERALRGNTAAPGATGQTRGDRLVLAAKLIVLTRLLGQSLGKEGPIADANVAASVETSRKKMASLRRRVLRSIEKMLERVGEDVDRADVLKALCAYSLANSSGAKDVLRHFLHVRGQAMAYTFEEEEGERPSSAQDVLRGLELYTRTLLDVQALVPVKLTDALLGVKKNELLADETLRNTEALRLDIYDRWCGDEIQYFKPYIRHDDLNGSQAKEMLTNWAKEGSQVLMRGLAKALDRLSEFKAIVELRTSVLELWIRDGGRARGFDPSIMLDQLREAINNHMLKVLSAKVNMLRLVGSEVTATLDGWREDITNRHAPLWDDTAGGLDLDLTHGAALFAQDVVARLHGRSDAVSKAAASYRSWYRVIDDVGDVVAQLRRQRWENDVDGDIEDEETIAQRQRLLSGADPQALGERLERELARAFAELEAQLAARWAERGREHASSGHIAMYFVRVLRDIRSKLPPLEGAGGAGVRGFGLGMVPALHERVAETVVVAPVDEFATGPLARRAVVGRALWEGEPALPVAPSPGAFRFLRDLVTSMGDAGIDLWSPSALVVLKGRVRKQLGEAWAEALQSALASSGQDGDESASKANDEDEVDGKVEKSGEEAKIGDDDDEADGEKGGAEEEEPRSATTLSDEASSQRRDLFIQWLLDILYLRNSLGVSTNTASDELKALEDKIATEIDFGDSGARQRLVKSSQDYWKRTSLLFGLLA